jgi:DNA-binding HxlR family transcriptional regulator
MAFADRRGPASKLGAETVRAGFPQHVEYELTEFGRTVCPAMKTLVDWAMNFPRTREMLEDR